MTRPSPVRVFAAAACAAAAAPPAAAQTQITARSGLTAGNAVFANPDVDNTVYLGPRAYAAPGVGITFASAGNRLEVHTANVDYFQTAFPDGTRITFAGGFGGVPDAPGPLTISFSAPVTEFGVDAEEFNFDPTTFSFAVYNGAALVGTYAAAGVGGSVLAFLGARAPAITRVVISDDNGNNIGVGPLSYRLAPASTVVPEPATALLIAPGLAALWRLRRRRAPRGGGR